MTRTKCIFLHLNMTPFPRYEYDLHVVHQFFDANGSMAKELLAYSLQIIIQIEEKFLFGSQLTIRNRESYMRKVRDFCFLLFYFISGKCIFYDCYYVLLPKG